MALGKKKEHETAIHQAGKLYDDSIKMFTQASQKINEANSQLELTIENLDDQIEVLQNYRAKAAADIERNNAFKSKLHSFTEH